MKNFINKFRVSVSRNKLNPANDDDRKIIIKEAVTKTVKEYGETLKKLGTE